MDFKANERVLEEEGASAEYRKMKIIRFRKGRGRIRKVKWWWGEGR